MDKKQTAVYAAKEMEESEKASADHDKAP